MGARPRKSRDAILADMFSFTPKEKKFIKKIKKFFL